MSRELLAAIQTGRTWLDRFTRRGYPEAFREYTERFGPAYLEAVRSAGGEETALQALADEVLDGLEAGWKRQRFWNRSSVMVNEKQMMVDYLTPMLLEQGETDCPRFAEVLRDRWATRWPKDAYSMATYAKLRSGFRYSILGIDLAGKHLDPENDRQEN